MKISSFLAVALVVTLSQLASAHKVWLLPSQTSLSGNDPWVTVDAAVSNDLFYFNHHPLRLDNLVITAPDGGSAEAQNPATGKYRSVFDVQLEQEGTYRIALMNQGFFASWVENGERKRWRGSAASFATEVPTDAENLKVTESVGRIETFVTNGAPSKESLKPTGVGIELVAATHPNDLYAGEKSQFQLLVEGKPAAGLEIEIIRGGTRYRDSQEEIIATTDENGEFTVAFEKPGMYWLSTASQDEKGKNAQAKTRRLSYAATLEVLPQ
ncbi:DUF4198 domain-containing protein [Rosistilla oblonga]|uniref:DUF4198 domain-containing protein n=1 Tax=Rosistilla oblonga TaxID=2527990 RepID=UPI003A97F144